MRHTFSSIDNFFWKVGILIELKRIKNFLLKIEKPFQGFQCFIFCLWINFQRSFSPSWLCKRHFMEQRKHRSPSINLNLWQMVCRPVTGELNSIARNGRCNLRFLSIGSSVGEWWLANVHTQACRGIHVIFSVDVCADILLSCCAQILGIMDHFFLKGTGQRKHRDEMISGPWCKTQIRLKARVGQRFLTQGEGRGRPVRMRSKIHERPLKTTPFFATQDKTLYLTAIPSSAHRTSE